MLPKRPPIVPRTSSNHHEPPHALRILSLTHTAGGAGFVQYDDSVARSSWDIDIWPADSYSKPAVPRGEEHYRERQQRLRDGDFFDIRYGCLVARSIDHLLMAGRCLSASHRAESSLRIQQTCMATGQAAGTAAALSLRAGLTPRELDPHAVIAQLAVDREQVVAAYP